MRLKNRRIMLIFIVIMFTTAIFILSNLNIILGNYNDLNTGEYQINLPSNPYILHEYLNPATNKHIFKHQASMNTNWTCPAGKVMKFGPFGNNSSSIKIAYIIGVHPAEEGAHNAIYNSILKNQGKLKYCYYIYKIQVNSSKDYNKNRYFGQLLAYKYAVNDIKKNNFDMVVDVHSNQGKYEKRTFIFTAIPNNRSLLVSSFLVKNLPGLSYYIPPRTNEPTSAPYISEPLIKNGTPIIVYETYRNESFNLTEKKAHDFIIVLDDFNFYN